LQDPARLAGDLSPSAGTGIARQRTRLRCRSRWFLHAATERLVCSYRALVAEERRAHPQRFALRAEWWKLIGFALYSVAMAAFCAGMAKWAWPDMFPAIGLLLFAFALLVVAARLLRSGIYLLDDSVVVRGVLVTRRVPTRLVRAVGVRGDSPYGTSRRPVCVGVVMPDGAVLAPGTLSGSRGSERVEFMMHELACALKVPRQAEER
jgi:hypothetical protein